MNFCNEHRADVRAENPGISVPELGRLLGEMWRELSQEEKDTYYD